MLETKVKKNNWFFRKKYSHLLVIVLILIFLINPLFAHTAHAGWVSDAFNWLGGLVDTKLFDATFGTLLEGVAWFFFFIAGFLANAFGQLLDLAIEFSIDVDSLKLPGIRLGWEIFRDVANMMFIFILLWIAVSTILQLGSFQTKKVLANLVIVALLVNFSFFLSGVVIDASNIVSGFIYNAAAPIKPNSNPPDRVYLGESLITNLKLPSILEQQPLPTGQPGDFTNMQKAFAYFMGGIILGIAAFTFLAGAILFIIRQVALIFILILAPIAFAAAILPKTRVYFDQWLHKLINYSMVAPIYLLLVSIVIAVSNSTQLLAAAAASSGKSAAGQSLNQAFLVGQDDYLFSDFAPIILNYIIIIGLLIATISITKNIAGNIATLSIQATGRLTGFGMGAPGAMMRGTDRIMRRLDRAVANQQNAFARGVKATARATKVLSSVTYDPRTTRLGKAAASGLKTATGIDVGQGKKGREIRKEHREREKEDKEARERNATKKYNDMLRVANQQQAGVEIGKMSAKEISKLDPKVLARPEVAFHFDSAALDAIIRNKDLDLKPDQRTAIGRAVLNATTTPTGAPPHANATASWLNNTPAGTGARAFFNM